jgi:hypothetical protein
MMLDQGYGGGDPKLRIGQLQGSLLRNVRYIAGIEMHTGCLTVLGVHGNLAIPNSQYRNRALALPIRVHACVRNRIRGPIFSRSHLFSTFFSHRIINFPILSLRSPPPTPYNQTENHYVNIEPQNPRQSRER